MGIITSGRSASKRWSQFILASCGIILGIGILIIIAVFEEHIEVWQFTEIKIINYKIRIKMKAVH